MHCYFHCFFEKCLGSETLKIINFYLNSPYFGYKPKIIKIVLWIQIESIQLPSCPTSITSCPYPIFCTKCTRNKWSRKLFYNLSSYVHCTYCIFPYFQSIGQNLSSKRIYLIGTTSPPPQPRHEAAYPWRKLTYPFGPDSLS